MKKKPSYFGDVRYGQMLDYKRNEWIKIIPSTHFVFARDMDQKLQDRLMKTGANIVCFEPIDSDEDIMLVDFLEDDTLVEVYQ